MIPASRLLLLVTLSLASTAYADSSFTSGAPGAPQRGQLLESPPTLLGSYSVSDLISKVTDGTISQWLLRRTFSPTCSVNVHQLKYGTIGAQGEPTTASGALMLPTGEDPICQGPRPIVLYAHGKRNMRSFNIADLSGQNYEALLLALALAGNGYIVVAPNYAGYDTSTLPYHPFLNADQQSSDMMDALAAARAALPTTNAVENQKLFITGYSQGGYVAMATHRALEAAGVPVTASAPMSGPYALSAFADAVFMGQVSAGAVEQFVMLAASYQHSYGNLYASPADVFEPQYASSIESLLPGSTGSGNLVEQGHIPDDAVFSSTPPTPELAPLTPATAPEKLAGVFARGFGTDHLVTNAYRLSYLQDALAAPDGGYPNTTTGLPPANPLHPLRQALKINDLRNWIPNAPVLLCAGDEDPVVFYLNTQLMEGYWAAHASDRPITILDVDAPPSQRGPYRSIRKQFADTKRVLKWAAIFGGADDGGRAAVLKDYHDVLVPAFCVRAARSFFDGF
ncbi:MAG: prolyl oligopeptidase family serine peptidase [Steroidobacteraceae bacterium]|nr:prolyl oligopeptidase family serine peptidase [Steroidobacteraceae bacterium]